jgi:hypothetical protein
MLPNKSDQASESPNASERRAMPRFEIFAQANVVSGSESYLMSVRNISASGAFLEGRPKEHADLTVGVDVEVALSATGAGMNDDEVVNIQCRGKVARIELPTAHGPGGFGIALVPATAQDEELLEDLIGRLADVPPALRSTHLG